jgi:DNA polymerase type B, organellar and viral
VTEKLPIEITGTLDLEASSWTHFALGVVYDGAIARHWWATDSELAQLADDLPPSLRDLPSHHPASRSGELGGLDGLIDYLRERGGIWWAHGGGVYDFLAILERCRARTIPCQVDRSQQRVTRIVIGRTTLRDSYSLWPVPLDDIAGALRRPVPSLPWECTCGHDCGAYCRIAEKACEGDPDLLDYCRADCVTLYDGLHRLREFCETSKIRLRGTLAQTAWIHCQDELGVPDSDMPWHLWRSVRKADKGGRQCVIRPRVKREIVLHHDICNSYPAQLAKIELPVGRVAELAGDDAQRAIERARPGIYSLTVTIPDSLFLPPLPYVMGGLTYFPTGKLTGTWCLPEIVCALERGASIDRVHSCVLWDGTASIFGELVECWYAIRKSAGRKTPLGQWTGRLAKSFCGKLSERPERQRVLVHPEKVKFCNRINACRNGCTGRCGAYEQIDLVGKIWGVPYQRLGGSCYPQWSAYLRAAARVQWLEQAERYGENLVMGHTDSLWSTGRGQPAPLGDELGQWEYQDAWTDMDIRSAAVYAGRKLPDSERFVVDREPVVPRGYFESVPGEFVVRGIPWATEADWKRGRGLIDRGVVTFANAARSLDGLWQRKTRQWTLPGGKDGELRELYGDRKLGAGGITYPMDAQEIRERVRKARDKRRRAMAFDHGRVTSKG